MIPEYPWRVRSSCHAGSLAEARLAPQQRVLTLVGPVLFGVPDLFLLVLLHLPFSISGHAGMTILPGTRRVFRLELFKEVMSKDETPVPIC